MLMNGYTDKEQDIPMKFYNLPVDPPEDRHKWFYGAHEAVNFIKGRAQKNNMAVIQIDREHMTKRKIKKTIFKGLAKLLFHRTVHIDSLMGGNVWAVLKKSQGQ